MLYKIKRAVPANTTDTSPDEQTLTIIRGTIKGWIIFFAPEAADLLGVKIFYKNTQIMPWSQDEWIIGFFDARVIDEDLKIDAPPYELKIKAYNDDDTFSHQYYIQPFIQPYEEIKLPETNQGLVARFREMIGGS